MISSAVSGNLSGSLGSVPAQPWGCKTPRRRRTHCWFSSERRRGSCSGEMRWVCHSEGVASGFTGWERCKLPLTGLWVGKRRQGSRLKGSLPLKSQTRSVQGWLCSLPSWCFCQESPADLTGHSGPESSQGWPWLAWKREKKLEFTIMARLAGQALAYSCIWGGHSSAWLRPLSSGSPKLQQEKPQ